MSLGWTFRRARGTIVERWGNICIETGNHIGGVMVSVLVWSNTAGQRADDGWLGIMIMCPK